ncbi:MAG: ParB N-terminal domain-containing protein [Gemmatimonadetes bacterium]|nr:ParB N-terminal domain-containing protein [Gemmatimonadota bacterium]
MSKAPRPALELSRQRGAFTQVSSQLGGASHPAAVVDGATRAKNHLTLPVAQIEEEGAYVREVESEEDLADLAGSIRADGDVPGAIGVRRVGPPVDPRFVLVYGRRRLHAAKLAGLRTVTVRDLGPIGEEEAFLQQIAENESRKAMSVMDACLAYFRAHHGFGHTQAVLAARAGKSPGYVSWMTKGGEALAQMTEEERAALARHPRMGTAIFRDTSSRPLAERVDTLRAMARSVESGAAQQEPAAPAPIRWSPARGGAIRLNAHLDPKRLHEDREYRAEVRELVERLEQMLAEAEGA